ncbi:hypothetical protein [Streptomyces sp. NPDC006333]|uniref:hypothetical protein n=1 Tax=Streptomyces sp. NPDC006333 TaxID=3156753 RepID=UPI0033A0650C
MSDVETKTEAPNPAHLAAVLRRRQAMRARLDAAEVLFEDVNREATRLLAEQYKATKSTKADVTLGDEDDTKFATVTRVGGEAEARVTDRARFEAWVRDTYPDHFGFRIIPARTEVFVEDAFTDRVLAAATAANTAQFADPDSGVIHDVPGVAIQPTRSPYFRWLFTRTSKRQPLDGRELAADAMQSGRLDLDAPLAIEAPAAEETAA